MGLAGWAAAQILLCCYPKAIPGPCNMHSWLAPGLLLACLLLAVGILLLDILLAPGMLIARSWLARLLFHCAWALLGWATAQILPCYYPKAIPKLSQHYPKIPNLSWVHSWSIQYILLACSWSAAGMLLDCCWHALCVLLANSWHARHASGMLGNLLDFFWLTPGMLCVSSGLIFACS